MCYKLTKAFSTSQKEINVNNVFVLQKPGHHLELVSCIVGVCHEHGYRPEVRDFDKQELKKLRIELAEEVRSSRFL